MAQSALKKRKEAAKAKRQATKAAPALPTPISSSDEVTSHVKGKAAGIAAVPRTTPLDDVPNNPVDESPSPEQPHVRPHRSASNAVKTLMHRLVVDAISEQTDDEEEIALTEYEEVTELNGEGETHTSSEGDVEIVATKTTKTTKRKGQKPAAQMDSDDDTDTENDAFDYSIEVHDLRNRKRMVEVVNSKVTMFELQRKLAEILNVFPTGLHVQYRFSTETKQLLPYDLTSQSQLDSMLRLLRPLVVPPILANGKRSQRKMKDVRVQIFDKNDSTEIEQKKKSSQKTNTTKGLEREGDQQGTAESDIFFSRKREARIEIVEQHRCDVHSLPDKSVACYKDSNSGACYPLTENNINFWATLVAKDPSQYSPDKVPQQLNVYNNAPRSRAQVPQQLGMAQQFSSMQPLMAFQQFAAMQQVLQCLPGVFANLAPAQLGPAVQGQTVIQPVQTAETAQAEAPAYPLISTWLQHCDCHPTRSGEEFAGLLHHFDKEGFRRIHQLTGERITVEKLAEWIGIGRGTADLLIRYAEEDAELVRRGQFVLLGDN